ncbi:PspC domain-containing protein [Corynebacterium minutissimum]|uniref:PspC domain-containing protein n=1 Tax=Corynebacterium minutissimum TaxID=38301 RepID=A0A2X4RA90_9CORY|nr:PspC domain-containing protein [Corynebacterium minutissimum]KHO28907.1 PspC family transcriptional regulator [Corynebacterium minutissimum]MCG7228774.1 PspC domain-containing protein [Corynebacterium minutissimum]MCG7237891.1 PspC domain-containing protein [Corynebacterium minutissimum]QPS59548.1 PspC domain-containing protein [Corynebacterium minutissimum]QQA79662.1 PspC domain-containing protein [Corynebacterium minutissimum]
MNNQRLTRSTTDTMIGGVCGGIADTYNLDPALVRVLFVAAALLGVFPGVLLYLILWVVIPVQ